MKIVEITESKMDELSEMLEDILYTGGRMMSCIEQMREGAYGERRKVGMREPMRTGMRDPYMDGDRYSNPYEPMYGERRYRR